MPEAEFGATLWGRAWLRTVERTDGAPRPRLPKARSLARNHKVELTLSPGTVTALVRDGSSAPTVVLNLAPWDAAEQQSAGAVLAGHSPNPSGDLPDDLLSELRDAGVPITPTAPEEDASCTCRARKTPCAHVLAALYALVLQVDERPVTAVEVRSGGDAPWGSSSSDPDWIALEEVDAAAFFDPPGGS